MLQSLLRLFKKYVKSVPSNRRCFTLPGGPFRTHAQGKKPLYRRIPEKKMFYARFLVLTMLMTSLSLRMASSPILLLSLASTA